MFQDWWTYLLTMCLSETRGHSKTLRSLETSRSARFLQRSAFQSQLFPRMDNPLLETHFLIQLLQPNMHVTVFQSGLHSVIRSQFILITHLTSIQFYCSSVLHCVLACIFWSRKINMHLCQYVSIMACH